jgi:RNA recognition motif-containing protein
MQLFIGRLPHELSKQQLCRFIARRIRKKGPLGLFQKNKVTFDCKIMVMRDKDTGGTEYFAVVSHLPYKIAQQAIKNLNRTPFNGKVLEVREYCVRSWKNDRRQLESEIQPEQIRERRIRDRRDRWTMTEVGTPSRIRFHEQAQFVRQYGGSSPVRVTKI